MAYDVVGIIEQRIGEVFDEEINWQTEFQTTARKYSGEVVFGNPRDTTDEAKVGPDLGYKNSFYVKEIGIDGITITSDDDDSKYINEDRPELEEYIVDNLDLEEIMGMVISNYFENLSL